MKNYYLFIFLFIGLLSNGQETFYKNYKVKNFIDFCYLLCNKYKSNNIMIYIDKIIHVNSVIVSKELKNYDKSNSNKSNKNIKNKNKRWIA